MELLKQTKAPGERQQLTMRITAYMNRAEQIKKLIPAGPRACCGGSPLPIPPGPAVRVRMHGAWGASRVNAPKSRAASLRTPPASRWPSARPLPPIRTAPLGHLLRLPDRPAITPSPTPLTHDAPTDLPASAGACRLRGAVVALRGAAAQLAVREPQDRRCDQGGPPRCAPRCARCLLRPGCLYGWWQLRCDDSVIAPADPLPLLVHRSGRGWRRTTRAILGAHWGTTPRRSTSLWRD